MIFNKHKIDIIKSFQDGLPDDRKRPEFDADEQSIFNALEPQLKDMTEKVTWEEMNKIMKEKGEIL